MSISSVASGGGNGPGIYGPIRPTGNVPKEKAAAGEQANLLQAALSPQPSLNMLAAQASMKSGVDKYI